MQEPRIIWQRLSALAAFFYVVMLNVYLFFSDKLAMYGQSGDPGFIEGSIVWAGIISQPWYFIVSGLIDGHPHMYLSWSLIFGAFSGIAVGALVFMITRKFPRMAPVMTFTYMIFGCALICYTVRDYPIVKRYSNAHSCP